MSRQTTRTFKFKLNIRMPLTSPILHAALYWAFTTGELQVKILRENAVLPMRGSAGAAGYDLCAAGSYVILSWGKDTIETGLAVALPAGTYARIAPRSGLAIHNFIDVGAGVVDSDYRGEIKVVLFNHSAEDFNV